METGNSKTTESILTELKSNLYTYLATLADITHNGNHIVSLISKIILMLNESLGINHSLKIQDAARQAFIYLLLELKYLSTQNLVSLVNTELVSYAPP